jgi:Protein of unknown function (DUF1573)
MQQIRILSCLMITSLLLMSFTPLPSKLLGYRFDNTGSLLAARATWAKDTHDFGEIPQSVPVTVEFAFTNTGDEALIIKDVITSCGCTASDYTKEPIMPGKSSKIKVSFNAANPGSFSKTITVNSNDMEAAKVLLIKGVVK